MAAVYKSVILGYSAEQMFALVGTVEEYPQFLPWCGGVEVREDEWYWDRQQQAVDDREIQNFLPELKRRLGCQESASL